MSFNVAFKKIFTPFRLKTIRQYNQTSNLNILDVGCGNNSCTISKQWLPISQYHGLDKEFWHGNEADYKTMDKVFYIDLQNELEKLNEVENEFYDVIILSHVIEHIKNGEEAITELITKLKKGGLIYVETPHARTLGYPSALGFFNFNDEPTHVMIYSYYDVARTMLLNDLTVLKAKTRRDWVRIIFFSPVAILLNILYYIPFKQKLYVTGLWDLFGVAFYVIARKK